MTAKRKLERAFAIIGIVLSAGLIVVIVLIASLAEPANATDATPTPVVIVQTRVVVATPTATRIPAGPVTSFGDGNWRVGVDILPGTYRAAGIGSLCYWARLSDFTGSFDALIANDNVSGPAVVTIRSSDAGFESSRCGTWQLQ